MSTPSPKDYTVLICHHVLYVDCILTGFIAYWSSNKILFCSVLFFIIQHGYTDWSSPSLFFCGNVRLSSNGAHAFPFAGEENQAFKIRGENIVGRIPWKFSLKISRNAAKNLAAGDGSRGKLICSLFEV